jgi:hypothetical protein
MEWKYALDEMPLDNKDLLIIDNDGRFYIGYHRTDEDDKCSYIDNHYLANHSGYSGGEIDNVHVWFYLDEIPKPFVRLEIKNEACILNDGFIGVLGKMGRLVHNPLPPEPNDYSGTIPMP